MSTRRRARRGFTLIEVLVSVTLCTTMSVMCIISYQRMSAVIHRAEVRVARHSDAQTIFGNLHRSLSSMEQHCAFVVSSIAASAPGVVPATGVVSVTFMRGKENNEDWQWALQNQPYNSDLLWETWTWHQADQTLYTASSSPRRSFQVPQVFKPSGNTDFSSSIFNYLPQPRRYLDPVHPEWTLNDNMLFPADPTTSATSVAGGGDLGDWQDLQNQYLAALTNVSDCALQVVNFDGSVLPIDDTQTTTVVRNGAWMDGRIGPTLATPVPFASSDLALRPRILRLRYTITEPGNGGSQTFAFSFALPGMAPPP
jgi:prepilin-type N-terminal cleavage/methylation domain-containing protein